MKERLNAGNTALKAGETETPARCQFKKCSGWLFILGLHLADSNGKLTPLTYSVTLFYLFLMLVSSNYYLN